MCMYMIDFYKHQGLSESAIAERTRLSRCKKTRHAVLRYLPSFGTLRFELGGSGSQKLRFSPLWQT